MNQPKKLIEVALPLEDINIAAAREKSIRHGHPSTLHLWWARRPLAAARAVLFAQLVDDPSGYVDELLADKELVKEARREMARPWESETEVPPTVEAVLVRRERERLFDLIRALVLWENTTNEPLLEQARAEIRRSWRRTCKRTGEGDPEKLPAFHDPFAGGGSIPLEAQRLGLEAHASDLNPVAVLINKAMIEIPPKFAGQPPVNPRDKNSKTHWRGAEGLAADVRYYGEGVRDEAKKRIGHLYPSYMLTQELIKSRPDLKKAGCKAGDELTVIAWLWARTVASPNPALGGVHVPLISTFMLSTKPGREAYVEAVVEKGGYRFSVKAGKPKDAEAAASGTKAGRGSNFLCVMSGVPVTGSYIKAEGAAGRMGCRAMAIVAEGKRGRVYLPPTNDVESVACEAKATWRPEIDLVGKCRDQLPLYGMNTFADIFTPRQLIALTTFSDLVLEARERIKRDALLAGLSKDDRPLRDAGVGASAYAEAVGVYTGLAVSKVADYNSSLVVWSPTRDQAKSTFARQALPMVWDFAEVNPLANAAGDLAVSIEGISKALNGCCSLSPGQAQQRDATTQTISMGKAVSTDPPYYDNIGYADLSDFFYVWLRHSMRPIYEELFSTLVVPKAEELVATPYRHGSKEKAEQFFLDGMTQAMQRLAEQAHPFLPVTVYYAFKQSESDDETGTVSTGWDTFLEAVIRAGFAITGTWPMRTERGARSIGIGANALASSIILVCRKRTTDAFMARRRDFLDALKSELPAALKELQRGNIAPVDLPQSSIGPGMAIFSRYSRVVESDGSPMTVRAALQQINLAVDGFLSEQEAQMDDWTRFASTWFSQYRFKPGPFGDAQNIATARNVSVQGVAEAGILQSGGGKVRLLRPDELPTDWTPDADARLTVWEVVHHLIRLLDSGGESAAAPVVKKVGGLAEDARSLCYRLYTLCEQNKWAEEARAYNGLIAVWPDLVKLGEAALATPAAIEQDLF